MGFFQNNLNIHIGGEAPEAAISEVARAVRQIAHDAGYAIVVSDGPADRWVLLSRHGGGQWLTLLDSTFDEEPQCSIEAASALGRGLGKLVVGVSVNDSYVDDFFFCRAGEGIATVGPSSSSGADSDAAYGELMGFLKKTPREGTRPEPQEILEEIGLHMSSWRLIGEYFSDETPGRGEVIMTYSRVSPESARTGNDVASEKLKDIPIPRFLCGHPRNVRRRWKKIVKKLVETRSWPAALEGEDFISIEDAPKVLLLEGGQMDGVDDDNVPLYVVTDVLIDVAADDEYARRDLVADLLLEGMKEFWVCLALLNGVGTILPPAKTVEKQRKFARDCVSRFMEWWEELCAMEGRYCGSLWLPMAWPSWARTVLVHIREMGMDHLFPFEANQHETAEAIRKWLADGR